jgi:hypothetical protein
MMEDTGTKEYHPSRGATSQPSGLVDLRGRVGDSTMKTWVDDDIKKAWEEKKAAEAAEVEVSKPKRPKKESTPDEDVVTPQEAQAAKEAALADMRAMSKENKELKAPKVLSNLMNRRR